MVQILDYVLPYGDKIPTQPIDLHNYHTTYVPVQE